jgi:hypothetical protein
MGSPESRPCERAELVHRRKLNLISDFLQSIVGSYSVTRCFVCPRSAQVVVAVPELDPGIDPRLSGTGNACLGL